MKAMVLRAPRDLVLDEVPQPEVDGREVLVRVTHSGICGTDFKIYSGAIPVAYPRIMGHEMVGEVVAPGVLAAVGSGDRVIVDPELYCGACFHCRIGQTHLCPNGILLGRDANGGFADYVTVPSTHVFPLPASIESRHAPVIQVLTTCLHAQHRINIVPGESVVVYGLGVTGQLHVQLAKARGASPVIGVTRSAEKRALAQTLGADVTMAGGDGAVQNVRDITGGRGADVVIETTGILPSVAAGIDMARAGGRLLLFGIITAREGALPFYDLYFKELALISARVATGDDYPEAIALVEQGTVRLEPLISDVVPLGDLKAAIGTLGSDNAQPMKIIIEHGLSGGTHG